MRSPTKSSSDAAIQCAPSIDLSFVCFSSVAEAFPWATPGVPSWSAHNTQRIGFLDVDNWLSVIHRHDIQVMLLRKKEGRSASMESTGCARKSHTLGVTVSEVIIVHIIYNDGNPMMVGEM